MSNWVLRAKILFYENKIYFDQTDSYYYFGGGVHCNYPVLIPLQEFWLSKIESNFNDSSFDWIALFYFLGLLVVSYGFLRKRISMFKSFVFVFFLLTMPLFFCHAYIPYADLPLTFFVFTAFVFFYDWLEKGKQKDLILFGIFSSASFMVKNDAAFFAIPALIIFIIAFFRLKRNWKDFFLLSALSFILIVPQLAIRFIYKQGIKNTDVDFYNFAFHPEVTKSFISSMIASFNWNIWWFLVPLLVIVNLKSIKKDSAMFYGWILAGLYFFELILMYFFTTEFRFVIDHVAFSRTLMPLISFTVLLTGLFFNDKLILKKKEESEM
jgi:4-amino-4-deoxy-L-arabinose transferase-like glycosyltransferase